MQFGKEQTPSFNLVYSSICYPAGMGTSNIRLLFATLLQHYTLGSYNIISTLPTLKTPSILNEEKLC